ncbi:unnamed protein product, partial [Prorocentrum cordatum]
RISGLARRAPKEIYQSTWARRRTSAAAPPALRPRGPRGEPSAFAAMTPVLPRLLLPALLAAPAVLLCGCGKSGGSAASAADEEIPGAEPNTTSQAEGQPGGGPMKRQAGGQPGGEEAPAAAKPRVDPSTWSETKKNTLITMEPTSCKSYAGKSRGKIRTFFGIGDNSYQAEVDKIGKVCGDYASLQKQAQKKKKEVEKLKTELKNVEAERDDWMKAIREAVGEIKRKGSAIDEVARLLDEHEQKRGK